MQRLRSLGLVLMIPAVAFLAAGCGGGSSPTKSGTTTPSTDKGSSGASAKKEMTVLASTGTATLKGQVVYDGDPPKPEKLKFAKDADKRCHEGDTDDLTWEVDPNSKGVKNVVIWVKPGDGKFFKHDAIPEALRNRKDAVEIDQPYCNFVPHVQAFNPSIFDGKKQAPTGQKFVVKNSAPIAHNTNYAGSPAIATNKDNVNLAAKSEREVQLKPTGRDDRSGDDLVNLACNIHLWMNAKLWVLDTPYFAVTDKDGKFEIKDVPAGAEIQVLAWHEEAGDSNNFVLPEGGPSRQGQKMTLEAGKDATLDFKIKKK